MTPVGVAVPNLLASYNNDSPSDFISPRKYFKEVYGCYKTPNGVMIVDANGCPTDPENLLQDMKVLQQPDFISQALL